MPKYDRRRWEAPRFTSARYGSLHRRNPFYNRPPAFADLAERYPRFKLKTFLDPGGKTQLDFQDPEGVRELTYTLLREHFNLRVEFPLDSLCPMIPNRLDYLLLIEDLLVPELRECTKVPIRGIDIGTGASCIYPLLACRLHSEWQFTATDIHPPSLAVAEVNVKTNDLADRITVVANPSPESPLPAVIFEQGNDRFDFCMCNPPFYESEEEIQQSRTQKIRAPSTACQGSSNEMITAGGEVQFVSRMITESCRWRTRVRWYTSLVGKLASLEPIVAKLRSCQINNYALAELHQGRTRRWVVIWSFDRRRVISKPPEKLPAVVSLETCSSLPPMALLDLPSNRQLRKLVRQPCFISLATLPTTTHGQAFLSVLDNLLYAAPPGETSVVRSGGSFEAEVAPALVWRRVALRGDFWSRRARRQQPKVAVSAAAAGGTMDLRYPRSNQSAVAGNLSPAAGKESVLLIILTMPAGQALTESAESPRPCPPPVQVGCQVTCLLLEGDDYALFESFASHVQRQAVSRILNGAPPQSPLSSGFGVSD